MATKANDTGSTTTKGSRRTGSAGNGKAGKAGRTAGSAETAETAENRAVVDALLKRHGQTYAEEAGIALRDTPSPLYRLLVLSMLLSARIRAGIAVASARALSEAGMRDPRKMADATWQQRVDALGEGGYRRYDERTATMLGQGAELLLREYGGDVRKMHEDGDPKKRLADVPGIGPTGVDIFLREAQQVWPEYGPYFDTKARQGAERLGLPRSPEKLDALVAHRDRARLAAGLVRAALDKKVVDDVRSVAA